MSKPDYQPNGKQSILPGNRMLPLLAAMLLLVAARYYSERNAAPPVVEAPPEAKQQVPVEQKPELRRPETSTPTSKPTTAEAPSPLVMRNLALRDQDGKVIYRGDIDLQPTLERIDAGRRLRFSNDGSTFQNREGRLPSQPAGHYREWVVPTPGEDGPGPQRLVTGSAGEHWYTADHYRTFQKLPKTTRSNTPTKNQRNDE